MSWPRGNNMAKSIIQNDKRCYVCDTPYNLHEHHVFGGPNRKKSEHYGLKVRLCAYHHNMSDAGVHFDKNLDNRIKKTAQRVFELKKGSRELFMQEFGKNYL